MLGLPLETAAVVFGFPLFWVVYTVVFLVVSRGWKRGEPEPDEGSHDPTNDRGAV